MHAQATTTPAQANEATPAPALKAKRAALHTILPGETPVQAAIRATEAQRKVMETAYETYTTADTAACEAKAALKAVPFPVELVVPVARKITDDPLTWITAIVCRHPDGREVQKEITNDRTERLETREAVVAHFGEDHPDLQERLAAFDRWDAETAPLRRALEKAEKAEQKTDRAWQRSYELNDRLCRAILEARAEPHEASQQADAYIRLLASSNGRDVQPKEVMYGEEAAPLLRFMHRALKRPDPTPPLAPPAGEVARLYPEWLAAAAASDDEGRFRELEEQIVAMPCRTVGDATAKLKVLLDVYEDGAMVMDPDHVVEQLKDAIAGLDEDTGRYQWATEDRRAWGAAVANRAHQREIDEDGSDEWSVAERTFYTTPAPDFAAVLQKLGDNIQAEDVACGSIENTETVDQTVDRLASSHDLNETCLAHVYLDIQRLAGLSPSAALAPTAPQNPMLIAAE